MFLEENGIKRHLMLSSYSYLVTIQQTLKKVKILE